MSDDDGDFSLDSVFPEETRPPTPGTTITRYTREIKTNNADDWEDIDIRLVGTHPLWGHYLWNAARAFATYLDSNPELYQGLSVLELGAGGGLPGLVTAKNGAQKVVLTDYPDADLVANLQYNVDMNIHDDVHNRVSVQGYIWGRPVQPLLAVMPTSSDRLYGFDLVILSDLIFNHSQHDALLETCELVLAPVLSPASIGGSPLPSNFKTTKTNDTAPSVLVFYTHHRPHLAYRDMEFFSKSRERGWTCEEILTKNFPPMFPEDPGEEAIRSTVHGWRLTRGSRS